MEAVNKKNLECNKFALCWKSKSENSAWQPDASKGRISTFLKRFGKRAERGMQRRQDRGNDFSPIDDFRVKNLNAYLEWNPGTLRGNSVINFQINCPDKVRLAGTHQSTGLAADCCCLWEMFSLLPHLVKKEEQRDTEMKDFFLVLWPTQDQVFWKPVPHPSLLHCCQFGTGTSLPSTNSWERLWQTHPLLAPLVNLARGKPWLILPKQLPFTAFESHENASDSVGWGLGEWCPQYSPSQDSPTVLGNGAFFPSMHPKREHPGVVATGNEGTLVP